MKCGSLQVLVCTGVRKSDEISKDSWQIDIETRGLSFHEKDRKEMYCLFFFSLGSCRYSFCFGAFLCLWNGAENMWCGVVWCIVLYVVSSVEFMTLYMEIVKENIENKKQCVWKRKKKNRWVFTLENRTICVSMAKKKGVFRDKTKA